MGFWAATAKRNTSTMKISHTSLVSWSGKRFKMNLWWTHSFYKVPWKEQQRRHGEYTFVSPQCVCVWGGVGGWQSQECVSSTLCTYPIHAHFDSDSCVFCSEWNLCEWRCGLKGINREMEVSECPRDFSSIDLTLVAPSLLPWCFADGNLGNIPDGGCNKCKNVCNHSVTSS